MSHRICPRCSGFVEVRHLGKHFKIRCSQCGASHQTAPGEVKDPVAAYFRFMDIMEGGEPAQQATVRGKPQPRSKTRKPRSLPRSKKEWERQLKKAGITSFEALPEVVQRILTDSAYRLVKYRQFSETIPEVGSNIDDAPLCFLSRFK